MGFFSLNQHYDIIICVYWFEMFSQVSDVAHGPLLLVLELASKVHTKFVRIVIYLWEAPNVTLAKIKTLKKLLACIFSYFDKLTWIK